MTMPLLQELDNQTQKNGSAVKSAEAAEELSWLQAVREQVMSSTAACKLLPASATCQVKCASHCMRVVADYCPLLGSECRGPVGSHAVP